MTPSQKLHRLFGCPDGTHDQAVQDILAAYEGEELHKLRNENKLLKVQAEHEAYVRRIEKEEAK